MPVSAINAVDVDYILPADDIAIILQQFVDDSVGQDDVSAS